MKGKDRVDSGKRILATVSRELTAELGQAFTLVRGMQALQRQAAQLHKPVVDAILHTRSRDIPHIENTLDGRLDFCGYDDNELDDEETAV